MSYSRVKSIIVSVLLLLISLLFVGCKTKTESIEFVPIDATIYVGESIPLNVDISPSDAYNQDVVFIGSNPNVATVNGDVLTAMEVGTVTITARQDDADFGSFVFEVMPILPESIVFIEEVINLGISRATLLSSSPLPSNTTDKNITYSSADPAIAKVEGNTLTAMAEGSALIIASHASGVTAECTVNVSPVLLESLEIKGVASMQLNATDELSVIFEPLDVTDKNIEWISSNKSIVSIETGVIAANKIGVATITAKHSSGIVATIEIEVLPIPAEKISLSGNTTSMYEKETLSLSAKILPEDATDKTITWAADNTSIAIVKNGNVTGVSAGTTIIRATTSNSIEGTYTITVMANKKQMTVTVRSRCLGYNSVGNEWGSYFAVNGKEIGSNDTITVTRNGYIKIYTEIVEYDSITDIGSSSDSFKMTDLYYEYGCLITQTVYVRENRGRYTGNIATWEVEYEFNPID